MTETETKISRWWRCAGCNDLFQDSSRRACPLCGSKIYAFASKDEK